RSARPGTRPRRDRAPSGRGEVRAPRCRRGRDGRSSPRAPATTRGAPRARRSRTPAARATARGEARAARSASPARRREHDRREDLPAREHGAADGPGNLRAAAAALPVTDGDLHVPETGERGADLHLDGPAEVLVTHADPLERRPLD